MLQQHGCKLFASLEALADNIDLRGDVLMGPIVCAGGQAAAISIQEKADMKAASEMMRQVPSKRHSTDLNTHEPLRQSVISLAEEEDASGHAQRRCLPGSYPAVTR